MCLQKRELTFCWNAFLSVAKTNHERQKNKHEWKKPQQVSTWWPLYFCLQIPVDSSIFSVYFKNVKYYFLSALSGKDRTEVTICNGQRSLLHTVGGLGVLPWWGSGGGGEGPGSTEDLAFYNIKNRLKNHLCCAFFCALLCVLLCSLNTGLNSERQLILV